MTHNLNPPQQNLINHVAQQSEWQDPKRKLWLLSPLAPVIG